MKNDDIKKEKSNSVVIMEDQIYHTLMSEFLTGEWHNFFNTWDFSFTSDFKKTIEYKIMTLKLRVHFAILPIRIVELNQHVNYNVFNKSNKVSQIFENAADKFSLMDYEKDLEDEKSKLTVASMKQLEEFLNSYDGQKLAKKLKGSSFTALFALPYIVDPHEDESIKMLFSVDWLEKLVDDVEEFVRHFCKDKISTFNQEPDETRCLSYDPKNNQPSRTHLQSSRSFPGFVKNEPTHQKRKVHSAIKNREIENWIASHEYSTDNNNSCTKSTQTDLTSFNSGTGFVSLINEPPNTETFVTPSVFAVPAKQQSTTANTELVSTKAKLLKIYKHYKKLRLRFHQLHEDYQKMNEIAEELTIALESSVQGQPVNFETIMQTCLKIFPDRFHRDIQTDSEDTSLDMQEDASKSNIFVPDEKENAVNNILVPPKLLDYEKIKLHLQRENATTKLLLLQALRQKITLNESEHRRETISEYVVNDLLGLWTNVSDANESEILAHILAPMSSDRSSSLVQQTAARLLNALASLKSGRNYLTSNPILLNSIIKYLDSCNNGTGDGITLDMLMATLQKMSLRKQQRNYMVEANLVEWLIHHLNDENFRASIYRLEYACALLMNLSLKSSARLRASFIASLFVSTMITLLSLDRSSILPYVNGALQNFLLNNEVNEEAKKFHLAEILEYHRAKSADERKHFSHTLRIHKRECDECLSDDDEFSDDEDDEIFDIPEKELEEDDPVKPESDNEFRGDQLLALCYSVPAFHLPSRGFFKEKLVEESRVRTSRESKTTTTTTTTTESKTSTLIATRESVLDDSKT